MVLENKNELPNGIPKQIYISGLAHLSSIFCVLVLNLNYLFLISMYILFLLGCYAGVLKAFRSCRALVVITLLVTLILNFIDLGDPTTIPTKQLMITLIGFLLCLISFKYLYSKTSRKWFLSYKIARKEVCLKKRLKKIQQYTPEEYQNFAEIAKITPASYQWGKWLFLLILFLEIFCFVFYLKVHGSLGTFWFMLMLSFDLIALIGLMRISEKLLNIYSAYLYACLCFFVPGSLLAILTILFTKFNKTDLSFETLLIFLPGLIVLCLKVFIFYNKQSRAWLRAKYILRTDHMRIQQCT